MSLTSTVSTFLKHNNISENTIMSMLHKHNIG